jgi:hypothetical protein
MPKDGIGVGLGLGLFGVRFRLGERLRGRRRELCQNMGATG